MVNEPPIVRYEDWDTHPERGDAWVGYNRKFKGFYVNARIGSPADRPYDEAHTRDMWWSVEQTSAFVERALANGATVAWGGVLPDDWRSDRDL